MTNATTKPASIKLPVLVDFGPVPSGSRFPSLVPGRGNAGWSMAEFVTVEERDAFMAKHAASAMPCWKRVVPGAM